MKYLLMILVFLVGCVSNEDIETEYFLQAEDENLKLCFERLESTEHVLSIVNADLGFEKSRSSAFLSDSLYWKERFQSLSDSWRAEQEFKSEYWRVMDSCLQPDATFSSSGVRAFTMCPTCSTVLGCSSASMMPLFSCKSRVDFHKVRSSKDVQVCDVIAFDSPNSVSLVHRVWKIYVDEEGVTRYATVGDNSQQFDNYHPRFEDILGEVGKVVNN